MFVKQWNHINKMTSGRRDRKKKEREKGGIIFYTNVYELSCFFPNNFCLFFCPSPFFNFLLKQINNIYKRCLIYTNIFYDHSEDTKQLYNKLYVINNNCSVHYYFDLTCIYTLFMIIEEKRRKKIKNKKEKRVHLKKDTEYKQQMIIIFVLQ